MKIAVDRNEETFCPCFECSILAAWKRQKGSSSLKRFTCYLTIFRNRSVRWNSFRDEPISLSLMPSNVGQLNNNGVPKRFNYFLLFLSLNCCEKGSVCVERRQSSLTFTCTHWKWQTNQFPSNENWKYTTALYDCLLIKLPILILSECYF